MVTRARVGGEDPPGNGPRICRCCGIGCPRGGYLLGRTASYGATGLVVRPLRPVYGRSSSALPLSIAPGRQLRWSHGRIRGRARKNLVPLLPPVDFVSATLAEPACCGLSRRAKATSLKDLVVLVCGGGPIGLFTALMAREAGARAVVISEIQERRRTLATALGLDAAVDPVASDLGSALFVFNPQGEADVSVDAVGILPTVEAALKFLKPGGDLVLLGGWKTLGLPMGTIVAKEARLLGSFNYRPEEFAAAANWVSLHRDVCGAVVSHTCKLQEGAEAFRRLAEEPSQIMKSVITLES